ncbi:MAG: hypothetical protein ABIS51_18440 [Sphingomonas sp.]
MSYLRLAGVLGGIGVAVAALIWITTTIDKAHQVDAFRACSKAAGSPSAALDACDKTIRPIVEAARRADLCETALSAKPVNLYAVRIACSEQVKRIAADRDVQLANIADANAQLATARSDTAAAIERAEARATSNATRKAANDQVIETAPRTADGRVRCDAECLRKLTGG